MRQLLWMMHARRSATWDHTSEIVFTLACVNYDPKSGHPRPKRGDFHPYWRGETGEAAERLVMDPKMGVNALASMLGAVDHGTKQRSDQSR